MKYTNYTYQAMLFAKHAHQNLSKTGQPQIRKYTQAPYIVHPVEVAAIVASRVPADENLIAAALLHDCIEDTTVIYRDINRTFGKDTADLVLMVTDISQPHQGNREARKAIDRAHIAKASARGQTLKLADLISNTKDILKHDQNFAVTYMREKQLLLPHLKLGDKVLFKLASEYVDYYFSKA
jgi:(p)ppGpp synthase/HD superfamily hydrolase